MMAGDDRRLIRSDHVFAPVKRKVRTARFDPVRRAEAGAIPRIAST